MTTPRKRWQTQKNIIMAELAAIRPPHRPGANAADTAAQLQAVAVKLAALAEGGAK